MKRVRPVVRAASVPGREIRNHWQTPFFWGPDSTSFAFCSVLEVVNVPSWPGGKPTKFVKVTRRGCRIAYRFEA